MNSATEMELAQLNIAKAKGMMDEPLMKEFVDNLESVNAMAESSEGFVWRLKDESGDATAIQAFDDPLLLVNMSVWHSPDALKGFIYTQAIWKCRIQWESNAL